MPSTRGSAAPTSVAEGLNGIATAISATMTAPDAGPYLQVLTEMQKIVLGTIHGGQKGPPQAQQQQRPMGPPGGGTNLAQLGGAPPSGPSAGPGAGPGPTSSTGISADDLRRMMGQQAAMAQ